MYLANKDLRKDYINYLKIASVYNLEEYIIDNKLEYAAFFYLVVRNKPNKKIFDIIKSAKYSYYHIKYVKDNETSRKIIEQSSGLEFKVNLGIIDGQLSSELEEKLLRTRDYKLIFLVNNFCKVNDQDKINKALLNSGKSKYIYSVAIKSKRNLQSHLNKLIAQHKKTYVFSMLKKYPNLDYSKYEDFLIKNKFTSEIKKFLSIKDSEKLKNYLILA